MTSKGIHGTGPPAFLYNIIPSGAAKDSLESRYGRLKREDEVDDLLFEYVRRDLLNRILGNTDNHGRNTSIMRVGGRFRLAPIYDLAPMILDEEGITRTTKWAVERKGSSNWSDNCAELVGYTDPDVLLQRLMNAAEDFRALPDLLTDAPESMRNAASLPVNNLDKRLVEWGLR